MRPSPGSPQPVSSLWGSSNGMYQSQPGAPVLYSSGGAYSHGGTQTHMGFQVVDVPVTTMVKQVRPGFDICHGKAFCVG